MSLLPIPLRPNYIQPPQPDGATHVYGFVLSDKVAEEVALQFDPNPTAEHVPYLLVDGYMQVNMYCQLKFQDYHLQWRRPVLGLVDGYVNHEQAVHMRKELGLGDEIPRWYEIAFIGGHNKTASPTASISSLSSLSMSSILYFDTPIVFLQHQRSWRSAGGQVTAGKYWWW